MKDTEVLTEAIVEMEENKAMKLTKQLLEANVAPLAVFEAYKQALVEVGKRFEQNVYFIPELVLSGNMMKSAMEIIKPYLTGAEMNNEQKKIGKIVIATVEGDIHDIGKNIVAALLEINGFEVKDLGADVLIDNIVSQAKEFGADIVGLSGLLTLAFDPMRDVVGKLKEEGLRDKIKVIIGGGQMDERVCQYVGADAFAIDAMAGINLCKEWMS